METLRAEIAMVVYPETLEVVLLALHGDIMIYGKLNWPKERRIGTKGPT